MNDTRIEYQAPPEPDLQTIPEQWLQVEAQASNSMDVRMDTCYQCGQQLEPYAVTPIARNDGAIGVKRDYRCPCGARWQAGFFEIPSGNDIRST